MKKSSHIRPDAKLLRILPAAVLAAVLLALLLASTALAGEPATVTVRVEGSTATLLGPTQVTTTTTPVVKDGKPADACPGTNAIGALELATAGDWGGKWEAGFGEYAIETILGESHLFSGPTYWEFWIDNAPSTQGACGKELKNGDTLLFFPGCYGECPPPANPLGIEAPGTAAEGSPVKVMVTSYENGSGTPSPAVGATVSYENTSTTTDGTGSAMLTFAHGGTQEVKVTAPASIRTETTVCVHAGNDGNCGTTAPSGSGGVGSFKAAVPPAYKGPFALVADLASIRDGQVFSHGHGPRLLTGEIRSHSSVSSVHLELRRSHRGRCSAYDGISERFVAARCGSGKPFQAATAGSFSYLLPAALGPGRYVLDVTGSDVAGNTVTLARGTSRLVFYVR